MSAPIDELLIAVRIEQGSNLMALYEMLKELMGAGGGVNIEFPWTPAKSTWTNMVKTLNKLAECCRKLHEVIPAMGQELKDFFQQQFENVRDTIIDQFMMIIQKASRR